VSYSATRSETYSTVDIENVFRRFTTDLRMIAASSGVMTMEEAEKYGHDIDYLAKGEYLKLVDVTLIANGEEVRAARYTVNTAAGDLTPSRPGGVLWPKIAGAYLSIVIDYTDKWWALPESSRKAIKATLKIPWSPSSRDISHAALRAVAGRSYVSRAYGVERQDYSQ
jgi:trehalose utilization protein